MRYAKLYTSVCARLRIAPARDRRKVEHRRQNMARPRTKGKRLQLGIDSDLMGWVEWQGRENSHGQGAYINSLIRADRDSKLQSDSDSMRRYRLYLEAVGFEVELRTVTGDDGEA